MTFNTKYSLGDKAFFRKGDSIKECRITRIEIYTYLYKATTQKETTQYTEKYDVEYWMDDRWVLMSSLYPKDLFNTEEELANHVLGLMGFKCGVQKKDSKGVTDED